jgi:ketosteroid isomerase-like protein
MMSVENIKAMVRRYVDEPWNKGNVAVFDEFWAPECTVRYDSQSEKAGREEVKQIILKTRASTPDFHADVDEIIVEGDRVAFHWKMSGTNEQGKYETTVGITLLRLFDGKIVEDRFLSADVKPEQPPA